MDKINILELFSGIGGFSKGLQDAGYKFNKHYFSEIDKHAIANYKYNFKNSEYVGSVTDVRGKGIERPNIITFGSPCQDFSLAGKRKGMEGQRSSLILHAIRLIRECRPDFFIWENVKGAYSSNDGADFWGIIGAFADIGGYRLEWQLLNTSWFLPQNRERIYLIGHLAKDGTDFRGVFPFTENDFLPDEQTKPNSGRPQTQYSTSLRAGNLRADDTFIEVKSLTETRTDEAKEIRKQSMKNGKDFSPRRGKELMERNDNNANTVTSTQGPEQLIIIKSNPGKENITYTKNYAQWDTSGKGYNSQQDRAFYENGNMGTLPSTRTENKINVLNKEGTIRRLTEIECERLQGFPDNWTEFGIYEKQVWINKKEKTFKTVQGKYKIPKTQRYKMLGNAVTVNVVKAIGQRLLSSH